MLRTLRIGLISTASAAALALGACAGTAATDAQSAAPRASQTAPSQPSQPSQPTTVAGFTDAQVRSYVAATEEIEAIGASVSAEDRALQAGQILQRHNLAPDVYNNIATRSRTDQALANRIAALRTGAVTDAQLRAFAEASLEIDPISRAAAAAPADQRPQYAQQIRDVLARHGLDGETYNGIAARAQSDQALAQRIAEIQIEIQSEAGATTDPDGGE